MSFSLDLVFLFLFTYFFYFLSVFVDLRCFKVLSFDSVNFVVFMHCVEHLIKFKKYIVDVCSFYSFRVVSKRTVTFAVYFRWINVKKVFLRKFWQPYHAFGLFWQFIFCWFGSFCLIFWIKLLYFAKRTKNVFIIGSEFIPGTAWSLFAGIFTFTVTGIKVTFLLILWLPGLIIFDVFFLIFEVNILKEILFVFGPFRR